jgi:branched-chain amino acid transport system permease protein
VLAIGGFPRFLTIFASGVAVGAIATLVALGFMLIFKATGVVNFAQGALVTLGAYVAAWASKDLELPIVIAYVVAVAVLFAVGVVLERFAYAPIRNRSIHVVIIATLGASIIIQEVIALWQGTRPQRLRTPVGHEVWEVAGARIPYHVLLMVAVTAVFLALLVWLFNRTSFGRQVRALAVDREAAQLQGIRVNRMSMLAFGLSAALSALGGVLIAPRGALTLTLGFTPMLNAFAAAILGGFGSLTGVAAAAMLLGLAEQLGGAYIDPGFKEVYPFVLMLLVIALRPQGLFAPAYGRRL